MTAAMTPLKAIFATITFCVITVSGANAADVLAKPNIVYILADDLGYGDVNGLNANGKIKTPNMDRLIKEGMAFTDAHSCSAVCSPSRYGILTGRYSWRTTLQSGVLSGESKPLIKPNQVTVASLLKADGYQTGIIGKWHLGMTLPATGSWTQPIPDGPLTHGFDYYFGISASLDMPPFDFIENDHFTEQPSATKKWVRQGRAGATFDAVNVLPTLTTKAVDYIQTHKGGPFFLYLPLNSPHTPIVPSPEWKGKSGMTDYADFVMETDWAVGQVLAELDKEGLTQNTIVMLASDNGASPSCHFMELAKFGHNPSYIFRGEKSDIWEGGHRIPFLVRWPGVVKPGSTCDQTVELSDLLATVADIQGAPLPATAGEDSFSFLPALKGTAKDPLHPICIYHSISGNFGIQEGQWKLELCGGSGGWSAPSNAAAKAQKLPDIQLYDLTADISEKVNVEAEHPDIVAKLTADLQKAVADGRTTAGATETNDHAVDIWKKLSGKEVEKLEAIGN